VSITSLIDADSEPEYSHLEGDVAAVADDLGADLDQFRRGRNWCIFRRSSWRSKRLMCLFSPQRKSCKRYHLHVLIEFSAPTEGAAAPVDQALGLPRIEHQMARSACQELIISIINCYMVSIGCTQDGFERPYATTTERIGSSDPALL
jgi:hypothetical protein